jgi:hypothetical protein
MNSKKVSQALVESKYLRYKSDLISIVALVFVWLAFVYRNFSTKFNSAIYPDNESMTNPLLSGMSRTLKANSWPLWNNTLWGGVPLYDQPQLTPFYPFYFLKFANYEGTLNSMRTVHMLVLFHILIFLFTSYLLLRVIKVDPVISFLGSVLIVFNLNTLGVLSWLSAIATIAWLPSVLAGSIMLFRDRTVKGATVFLLSVLLIASAAPSHRLIFSLYLTLVIAIYFYFQNKVGFRASWMKSVRTTLFKPTLLFLVFFIPIFLPFFVSTGGLIRWVGSTPPGYVIGNDKIPFANFTEYQLSWNDLRSIVFAPQIPNTIGSAHLGLLLTGLFLLSIFFGFKERYYKLFFFIASYSLMSSLGSNSGFAYLNYNLPFLDKIREPIQFLTLWNICVGICIAIGLKSFLERRSFDSLESPKSSSIQTMFQKNKRAAFSILFATSFTFSHYLSTPWVMSPFSSSTYVSEGHSGLNLVFDEIKSLDPTSEYRVVFDSTINSQIAGGLASFKGIRTLQSLLNPAPISNFRELYFYDGRGSRYIDLLGIKYGICKGCGDLYSNGSSIYQNFEFLKTVQDYSIFINSRSFPYVSLATNYQASSDSMDEFVSLLPTLSTKEVFNVIPKSIASLLPIPPSDKFENCNIDMLNSTPNSREFIINCRRNSVVILNEYYTRDWKVKINDKISNSFPVNQIQIGAFIPAGKSIVSFEFYPDKVRFSFITSLALMIFLVALQVIQSSYVKNLFLSRPKISVRINSTKK